MASERNRRLLSASIAHQAALLRYGTQLTRDLLAMLNAADDEILVYVARKLRSILGLPYNAQRLELGKLNTALATINAAAFEDVEAALLGAAAGLVVAEESWQSRLLAAVVGAGAAVTLSRTVREAILGRHILGRTLEEQTQDMAVARLRRIEEAIGSGVSTGAAWQEVVVAIEGTPGAGFADGALEKSRRALDAAARTDVVGIADATAHAVYEESGVVRVELWVSVLDDRTTPVCSSNSGATRPIGEREWSNGYSGENPPAHHGCRSVLVPQTEREAANILTYREWLEEQPAPVQREILGPARWQLWRDGRVTIDRFVDDRGRPLRLDELPEYEEAV